MKKSFFTAIIFTLLSFGAKSQPMNCRVAQGAPNSNEIPNTPKLVNGRVYPDLDAGIFVYLPKAKVQLLRLLFVRGVTVFGHVT